MDKKFDSPMYNFIWNQIHKKNTNQILVLCGKTGSGKSYTALRIASDLDPSFNKKTIRERVFVDPESFLKRIVDRDNKLEVGQAIILDEMGVSANSRSFMSKTNRSLSFISQTFRRRNLLLIMCLPNFNMLDSQIRSLVHIYIEANKIIWKQNKTECKVYMLSVDRLRGGDAYRKCFRAKNDKGERVKLKAFRFKKPPASIWKEYERYSDELKDKIETKALDMVKQADKKKPVFNVNKIAKQVIKDMDKYTKELKGETVIDRRKLEVAFGIGARRSGQVRSAVETLLENDQHTRQS